jgi:hypothetical protein
MRFKLMQTSVPARRIHFLTEKPGSRESVSTKPPKTPKSLEAASEDERSTNDVEENKSRNRGNERSQRSGTLP